MIAQLIPGDGSAPITLNKDITVVGRSSRLSDLVIDHTSISKVHCILVKTDGLIYMRDLGSTNGTRVNGQRVIRGALLPGDQLAFAGMSYKVHLGPARAAEPRVPAGDVTERIPVVAEDVLEGFAARQDPPSKSNVRLLSDSDLLPPD